MSQRKLGIVIGTNEYSDSKIRNLRFAEKDARDIKNVLLDPVSCGFDKVVESINKHNTDTLGEIEDLFNEAEYNDLLLVYYSGHGELYQQNDLCLLFKNTRMDRLLATSLNYSIINKCITASSCETIIVILDCCYSGAAGIRGNNLSRIIENNLGSGKVIISASSEFDIAKEDEKLKNGVFTHYLIKGICGGISGDNDGNISLFDLYNYAYKKTKEMCSQTPYIKMENAGNIIIGKSPLSGIEKEFERNNTGALKLKKDLPVNEYSNFAPSNVPKTFTSPSTGMEFVMIPAGKFIMGAPKSEFSIFRRLLTYVGEALHIVIIKNPFYIGKYPVTQKQWEKIMGKNPSKSKCKDRPVEMVSWNDVQEFIKKINKNEGTNKYRLPSEAEWEYACRAGTQTRYSFGDDESKLNEYAWYKKNSGSETHPIGQKKPNHWGLYDMHGNVWEWVQDKWHDDYDYAPSDGSAWEDGDGSRRVCRGGCCFSDAGLCRSSRHFGDAPEHYSGTLGFRLVREM